jgi:endonuclease/exonuclease/phosphatase family metal-dependent hydrolase
MNTGRLSCLCLLALNLLLVAGRAEVLTIATYNVENYTLADRMVDSVHRKEYPKPEAEKTALRAVIRQLDVDVLALQEIGGEPFLNELQRDLKREGADYPHRVVLQADDNERMIAVLSKRPFAAVRKHDDLIFRYFNAPSKVKRGLLEVRFATASGEVTLFVVHLKSRYTERSDDPDAALQRAGEAAAIRDRVLTVFTDLATSQFLIAGDFNDGPTSRPVRAMLERGSMKITDWLPAADERGHVWTHFYRREASYSRVDHILVSPGLLPRVRGKTGRIQDSPEVGLASDHRPVSVAIE